MAAILLDFEHGQVGKPPCVIYARWNVTDYDEEDECDAIRLDVLHHVFEVFYSIPSKSVRIRGPIIQDKALFELWIGSFASFASIPMGGGWTITALWVMQQQTEQDPDIMMPVLAAEMDLWSPATIGKMYIDGSYVTMDDPSSPAGGKMPYMRVLDAKIARKRGTKKNGNPADLFPGNPFAGICANLHRAWDMPRFRITLGTDSASVSTWTHGSPPRPRRNDPASNSIHKNWACHRNWACLISLENMSCQAGATAEGLAMIGFMDTEKSIRVVWVLPPTDSACMHLTPQARLAIQWESRRGSGPRWEKVTLTVVRHPGSAECAPCVPETPDSEPPPDNH